MGADDGWDVDDGRIGQVESDRERIERLEGWAARSREQVDRIGKALDPYRAKLYTGEPTCSDAEEIERLVRERERLRMALEELLRADELPPSTDAIKRQLDAMGRARAALRRNEV